MRHHPPEETCYSYLCKKYGEQHHSQVCDSNLKFRELPQIKAEGVDTLIANAIAQTHNTTETTVM